MRERETRRSSLKTDGGGSRRIVAKKLGGNASGGDEGMHGHETGDSRLRDFVRPVRGSRMGMSHRRLRTGRVRRQSPEQSQHIRLEAILRLQRCVHSGRGSHPRH